MINHLFVITLFVKDTENLFFIKANLVLTRFELTFVYYTTNWSKRLIRRFVFCECHKQNMLLADHHTFQDDN